MIYQAKAKFDEPLVSFFSSNSANKSPFVRKYPSEQDDDEIFQCIPSSSDKQRLQQPVKFGRKPLNLNDSPVVQKYYQNYFDHEQPQTIEQSHTHTATFNESPTQKQPLQQIDQNQRPMDNYYASPPKFIVKQPLLIKRERSTSKYPEQQPYKRARIAKMESIASNSTISSIGITIKTGVEDHKLRKKLDSRIVCNYDGSYLTNKSA